MSSERAIVLRAAAAARSAGATERARHALAELDRRGETISFVRVAAYASVSRQFLYSHSDLRLEIERLRHKSLPGAAGLPMGERANDDSVRVRLRAALDEHKRLRGEIAARREELAHAHGRVRELELTGRAIRAC